MRRSVAAGTLAASRIGDAHVISARQVQALARTGHRGRHWSEITQEAALDLLSTGSSTAMSSSDRSRLKKRLRTSEVGMLAGQLLRGRVTLRRTADGRGARTFAPTVLRELGLSAGGGLGVVVTENAVPVARRAGLAADYSGDVAVVEGTAQQRAVLEALALFTYGDARESAAASTWIEAACARL